MKKSEGFITLKDFLIKIKLILVLIILMILNNACTRYRPALMVKFTEDGEDIRINRLVKGFSPAWSPDGKKLVFQNEGIWIVEIETRRLTKITHKGSTPKWSPDGSKIAYVNNGIWIWDMNSMAHRQISTKGDHPCWYPDSNNLAISYRGIWQMDINGNINEKIIDSGIPLSISSDSSLLLLEMWQPDYISFELSLLHLLSFEKRHLTNGTKGSFSPDNKFVVYSNDGIWIYSMDKKHSTRIVMDGYNPKWSPIGDKIALCIRDHIWIVDAPYRQYR